MAPDRIAARTSRSRGNPSPRLATAFCAAAFCLVAVADSVLCETEGGDAGSLPYSAQRILRYEELRRIDGELAGKAAIDAVPDFEDMYLLRIVDPAGFSARTVPPPCEPQLENPQLFLFSVCGSGVAANDDAPPGSGSVPPQAVLLPLSSGGQPLVVQPGLYFLAITGAGNVPLSVAGPMFDGPLNQIVGPGPAGLEPIIGWTGKGGAGRYTIELTGCAGIYPARCGPDLNGDAIVDGADLGLLLGSWGGCAPCTPCPPDLSRDDSVDGSDLGLLLASWGGCPPAAQGACGDPASGSCYEVHGPGCEDPCCCTLVCADSPFCCDFAWDGFCVELAIATCPPPPLVNDECTGAVAIQAGTIHFSTVGATTSPEPLPPECDRGFGLALVDDIWFLFVPSQSGAVLVSTCEAATTFDTRLAVYEGSCDLPHLIGCNDDAPCLVTGLASSVVVPVAAGEAIRIRVGGFSGSGVGALTIKHVDAGCAPCPPGALDEGEPCGADTNGGCNAPPGGTSDCCAVHPRPGCDDPACQDAVCAVDPFCCDSAWDALCVDGAIELCAPLCLVGPPLVPVACGDAICGTGWASGGIRDTDWFELTLAAPTTLSLAAAGELPLVVGIVATGGVPDCSFASSLDPFIVLDPCVPGTVEASLPPGTWWLFVAPAAFDGFPCGKQNAWRLEVSCAP